VDVSGRLAAWLALVGAQILLGYSARATQGKPDRNVVYHWSTFAQTVVYYGIFLAIVLLISRGDTRNLLALRPPRSWGTALGVAAAVIVGIVLLEAALDPVLHADREQGLTPTHWEPAHAAAFVASFVALVLIGPFVEEATFRGLGYSLLAPYGSVLAIVGTGVLFGLAHGLVDALPILTVLGVGLAYLRARTESLYPAFGVHALFNAIALMLAVTT
jgi:membrane protease YdiL (CAAX protease family)